MKLNLLLTLILTSIYFGCGTADDASNDGPNPAEDKSADWQAFYILSEDELPECKENRVGQLWYIEASSEFKACKVDGWATVEIKGADGADGQDGSSTNSGVKDIYSFHVDSYLPAANPVDLTDADDAGNVLTNVGDVRLTIFQDGSSHLHIAGKILRDLQSGTGTHQYDWSHSFFVKASDSEQTITLKLTSYAGARLRVKVNTSTPSVLLLMDLNNDYADNADTAVTLTKE